MILRPPHFSKSAAAIKPARACFAIVAIQPEDIGRLKVRNNVGDMVPLGRPGYPDDYIGTALWLASEASAFVTGAMLPFFGQMHDAGTWGILAALGLFGGMGQLLLTAGTKGKRYITPNARVLLHQPHGGFGGTSSDIQTQAALILDMKKRLAEITAEQTGKTVEQINADGDRDRWFTAKEALEYGFVDHIRESAADVIGGGGTK